MTVEEWRQRAVELRAMADSFPASQAARHELRALADQWDAMAERKARWLRLFPG